MAYGLKNINVLDLRPSTGIGVQLPFSTPGVFQTVYTTQEQLKYNIINYLLTNNRERIFNPNFGANIRSQLFRQIEDPDIDALSVTIKAGIANYFSNIVITKFTIIGDPEAHSLTIEFSYKINNTGASDNIIINING
jgi:phage baseplate assembly protein W